MSKKNPSTGAAIKQNAEAGHNADPASKAKRLLLLQKLVLFAIAFLVYAGTINHDFNLDDELYHSHAVKLAATGTKGIVKAFTTRTFIDAEEQYEYRPVTLVSFVIQYELIGMGPNASHALNVILYALSCLLLFMLLCKWFGPERSWPAFFIALLFTLHPLHTEIVNSIKSRDELLAFFFVLLSFLAAWKTYTTSSWKYVFATILFFLLAVLSKKTIWPFAFLIPLAFFFFSNLSLKKIVIYSVPVFASLPLLRLVLKFLPHAQRTFYEHENPFYTQDLGIMSRTATALYVMGRYMLLHIFPYKLAYYYGASYIPIVTWGNIWVWFSLVIHLLIVVYIIKNFRKRSMLVFGATIYLAGIFICSNMLRLVPGLMAERFAYMASLGYCIVLCSVLYALFKVPVTRALQTDGRSRQLLACIILVGSLYAVRCIARNDDWRNKYTLYTHDMPYLRSSAKANVLHGDLMMNLSGKYRETAAQLRQQGNAALANLYADSAVYYNRIAIENFKQSLRVTPRLSSGMSNLALAYFAADSQLLARKYLVEALEVDTSNAKLSCNLGIIYLKAGMYDSAMYRVKKAIDYDNEFAVAYQTLCDIQLSQHDTAAAISTLQLATENITNPIAPYIDLADIALHQHDTATAVKYLEETADMKPGSMFAMGFLANYYQSKKDMERANYYYNKYTQLRNERGE